MKSEQIKKMRGFSLLEMMLAIFIVILVSAIAVSNFFTDSASVGGAERLLEETASRLVERRASAVRLNDDDVRTGLSELNVNPLPMDFSNLLTTGSLRIDGADVDKNCIDDVTGLSLTCLTYYNGESKWSLAVSEDYLELPRKWKLVQFQDELNGIPLIGGGKNGRGVVATKIGFDGRGFAYAVNPQTKSWESQPTGSQITDYPSGNDAPFWSIYFILPSADGELPKAAIAVAIHPSGLIERFRFDGSDWIGFKNRTLK